MEYKSWNEVWRRRNRDQETSSVLDHSYKLSFHAYDDVNMALDFKMVALRAAPYVVSIGTFSGEKMLLCGSGIIIGCDCVDGGYEGTILTSATLLRSSGNGSDIANNLKVCVCFGEPEVLEGQVLGYNMPYNIALLKIHSDVQLATTSLHPVDDSFLQSRPNSKEYRMLPGKVLMALGRLYQEKHSFMAAAGLFSTESCNFDCQELLRVKCRISQAGIGGPIVNSDGEVVGISFYAADCTPFLPSNVVLKWLGHYKKNLAFVCLPQFQMQIASLRSADLGIRKDFVQKFPSVSSGILVKKLHDIAREKVGEPVELVIGRPSNCNRLKLTVVLAENSSDQVNSWPLPEETMRQTCWSPES